MTASVVEGVGGCGCGCEYYPDEMVGWGCVVCDLGAVAQAYEMSVDDVKMMLCAGDEPCFVVAILKKMEKSGVRQEFGSWVVDVV